MADLITPTSNLNVAMPDGYYEVVGHKNENVQHIQFGGFTVELENFGNLKVLSMNPLLASRWENEETQKYYPYSYSILWEKRGSSLRWHIYMNHTGNAQTGHPAFRAYFETEGQLDGGRLVDMALIKGSENSLFLQQDVDGKKYDFNDITSRTAKPKHLGTYSKSVQWVQSNEKIGLEKLYEFTEINTPEDIAEIAAQQAKGEEATPIGFGSIRHLLAGDIHAQLTFVVRQIDQDLFDKSVQPGKMKAD
ncbi:MAG: hypothetical protein P8H03_11140 [Emcibacteraceae bacterium]|nr:hypothetical protein [Emcibacteraceae bacterium]MDG1857895.1 hypothetical protein [Emcibacteraceae bacterium]